MQNGSRFFVYDVRALLMLRMIKGRGLHTEANMMTTAHDRIGETTSLIADLTIQNCQNSSIPPKAALPNETLDLTRRELYFLKF